MRSASRPFYMNSLLSWLTGLSALLLVIIDPASVMAQEPANAEIRGRVVVRNNPDGSLRSVTIRSTVDTLRYVVSKSDLRDSLAQLHGAHIKAYGSLRQNEEGKLFLRVQTYEVERRSSVRNQNPNQSDEEGFEESTSAPRKGSSRKKKGPSLKLRISAAATYDNNVYTYGQPIIDSLPDTNFRSPYYKAGMRSHDDWYAPLRARLQFSSGAFRASAGGRTNIYLHNRKMDSYGLNAAIGLMGNMYAGLGYSFSPYSPTRFSSVRRDSLEMLWSRDHKVSAEWYMRKTFLKPGLWASFTNYDYCPAFNNLDGNKWSGMGGLRVTFGMVDISEKAGMDVFVAVDSSKNAEYRSFCNEFDISISPKPWSAGIAFDFERRVFTTKDRKNSGRDELRGSIDPFVRYSWGTMTTRLGLSHSFRQTRGMTDPDNRQRSYNATAISAGLTWDLDLL